MAVRVITSNDDYDDYDDNDDEYDDRATSPL